MLGIVSDDVQQTVESFKSGNTAVMERNHTVVLNTNRTTPNLLRQVRLPRLPLRSAGTSDAVRRLVAAGPCMLVVGATWRMAFACATQP